MMGLESYKREREQRAFSPCPCEISEKAAFHKPGRELSSGTKSASTLILDFSAPQTLRSKWY